MVIEELWKYINERYPLRATAPLSVVLVFGALNGRKFDLALCLTLFLSLLSLRIADDLSDIEKDTRFSPQRSLVSGAIKPNSLIVGLAILLLLVLTLNLGRPSFWAIAGLIAGYRIFFLGKGGIPILVRPFVSNVFFLTLPAFGLLYVGSPVTKAAGLLGVFLWLSAVGHEFTHSLGSVHEPECRFPQYTDVLSRRGVALLGSFLYLAGVVAGALLAISQRSLLPAIVLLFWLVGIGFMCGRLLCSPEKSNARPFYVYGFLFVLWGVCLGW